MPNTVPDPAEIFANAIVQVPISLPAYGQMTTTGDIRAVFGLSDAELPDEMLTSQVYLSPVALALATMDSGLAANWEQRKLANPNLALLVGNFVIYHIANSLCDVLPVIVARTMTDSKASFQRFDTDMKEVIAAIRKRFAVATQSLLDALVVDRQQQIRTPVLFGSGKPTYDRVTGA